MAVATIGESGRSDPALRRSRAARNPRRRSCTRTQRRDDGTQAHTQPQRAGARSDRRRLGRPHGLRQRRRGQADGGSADEIRRHGDRGRQAVASLRPEVRAGRARDRRTHELGQGVSRGSARSPRPRPHAAGRAEGHSRRGGALPRLDSRRRRYRPRTAGWQALGDTALAAGQLHRLRRPVPERGVRPWSSGSPHSRSRARPTTAASCQRRWPRLRRTSTDSGRRG